MPTLTATLRAATLLAAVAAAPVGAADGAAPRSLGGAPVCEASAVLHVPCASAARGCWLVGDNEVRTALFLYPVRDDGAPDVGERRTLSIDSLLGPRGELSDVEALARRQDGELLVYASHSRNKRCERRKKRRAYLGMRLEVRGGTTVAVPGPTGFVRTDAKSGTRGRDDSNAHFGDAPTGALADLAAAVRAAERAAETGDCSETLDVEAAVSVPLPTGDVVWLGLRAPVLGEEAVLVRHDPSEAGLRFTEARRVRTGGVGIRALAFAPPLDATDDGWVYGVSPERGVARGDPARAFRLWRFPAARLGAGANAEPIDPEPVARVAPRSEGVAIADADGGRVALVVQDGREGDAPDRCKADSTYQVVPLPGS